MRSYSQLRDPSREPLVFTDEGEEVIAGHPCRTLECEGVSACVATDLAVSPDHAILFKQLAGVGSLDVWRGFLARGLPLSVHWQSRKRAYEHVDFSASSIVSEPLAPAKLVYVCPD